jgi:hypothetical protein
MEDLRSTVVQCIIAITRVFFFWLPGGDIAHGAALSAFHPVFLLSWVFIFFLYPFNRPLRILICLGTLITMVSQWYFKGCIITRAEQILTGSKDTIIDPLLHFARIKPTHQTRLAITLGMSTMTACIMIFSIGVDILSY